MFPPVSVARPNKNPPAFVRTTLVSQDQLENAGRFRKRFRAARNCFSTWLPVALRYMTHMDMTTPRALNQLRHAEFIKGIFHDIHNGPVKIEGIPIITL